MDNARVFKMAFASVYPHHIAKAEKKGRTKEEVHAIIHWQQIRHMDKLVDELAKEGPWTRP